MSPMLTRPRVLMLGDVVHARDEFKKLSDTADVIHVREGDRASFLNDCQSGRFNGVTAISRTVESAAFTGLFDVELVDALPSSIKTISHNGAGYDQISVPACSRRGIAVSYTPGAVDAATADVAMFLLLGAMRRAWIAQSAIRNGNWRGKAPLGHDPEGKTLGILGMGGIGSALARRAAAFGFQIQYHNRRPASSLPYGDIKFVDLETLLTTSDVISVHLPLSEKTKHFIGRQELAKMKHGVVIINTARGPVIDEAALVEALEDGDRIWSVGLDVFEDEPRVHPELLANEKVMLLPHMGTATKDTQKKMEILVIDNVRSSVREGKLLTPVPS